MPASLWWAVGDHEVYHHETEIGEIIGDGYDLSELSDFERRKALNARHLTETAERTAYGDFVAVSRGRHRVPAPLQDEQSLRLLRSPLHGNYPPRVRQV